MMIKIANLKTNGPKNNYKLKHTSATNNKTLRPGKVQKIRAWQFPKMEDSIGDHFKEARIWRSNVCFPDVMESATVWPF